MNRKCVVRCSSRIVRPGGSTSNDLREPRVTRLVRSFAASDVASRSGDDRRVPCRCRLLRFAHMLRSIGGCDRALYAKGFCVAHYFRDRAGDLKTDVPIRPKDVTRGCEIEGCERKHYSRGMCELHYRRWKRRGEPEHLLAPHGLKGARSRTAPSRRKRVACATATTSACSEGVR